MKVINAAILLLAFLCISQCSLLRHLKAEANHQISVRWTELFGTLGGQNTYAIYADTKLIRFDVSYSDQNVICAIGLIFQNVITNKKSAKFIGNFCDNTLPVSAQSIRKIFIGVEDEIKSIQFELNTGVQSKVIGVETDEVRTVELAENERIVGVEVYQQDEDSPITGIKFLTIAK